MESGSLTNIESSFQAYPVELAVFTGCRLHYRLCVVGVRTVSPRSNGKDLMCWIAAVADTSAIFHRTAPAEAREHVRRFTELFCSPRKDAIELP